MPHFYLVSYSELRKGWSHVCSSLGKSRRYPRKCVKQELFDLLSTFFNIHCMYKVSCLGMPSYNEEVQHCWEFSLNMFRTSLIRQQIGEHLTQGFTRSFFEHSIVCIVFPENNLQTIWGHSTKFPWFDEVCGCLWLKHLCPFMMFSSSAIPACNSATWAIRSSDLRSKYPVSFAISLCIS